MCAYCCAGVAKYENNARLIASKNILKANFNGL